MSWSSFSSALNTGFINQVFLCMLFWCGVLFLTSLAAMMSEWWSWDVFECSVGSKAETSSTISILKTKHTMFFWTCFPSSELLSASFKPCSTSPASSLLTKQERKTAAESMCTHPEAAAAAEGALLSPSCAHPPAAKHHSAELCPFNGSCEFR